MMTRDVRKHFKNCHVSGTKRIAYIGTQLARGGIDDMDVLCALVDREPEKLLTIRNIGPKNLEIIHSVCAAYRDERKNVPEGA